MEKETFEKLAHDSQERIRQIEFRMQELTAERKEIDKILAKLDKDREMNI